jgi:hypothetical protein
MLPPFRGAVCLVSGPERILGGLPAHQLFLGPPAGPDEPRSKGPTVACAKEKTTSPIYRFWPGLLVGSEDWDIFGSRY